MTNEVGCFIIEKKKIGRKEREKDFMNYESSELYFLEKDVLREFGEELGGKIFIRSAKLYAELVVTTDYRGSKTLERQLTKLVYPALAYYKTLIAFGYRKDIAIEYVRKEMHKAAEECAEVLAAQVRPVFAFRAFRGNIKKFMEYKFPSEAWICSGLKAKRKKITFQIDRCFYCEFSKKFGCSELAEVFCDYEKKAFGKGMRPKIVFECGGEIARGYEHCSFCFRKGERGEKSE